MDDVGNPQPRPFALADLTEYFDSVVMLTWSDWKTEPRSNRYHYATRFSEKLPVYFVQPDSPPLSGRLERTEFANITIVHSGQKYGRVQSLMLEAILAELDVKRPLIWVYNVFFHDFIVRHTNQMIVYHATEDYLCDASEMFILNDMDPIIEGFDRILPHVDLVIAVAEFHPHQFPRARRISRTINSRAKRLRCQFLDRPKRASVHSAVRRPPGRLLSRRDK